MRNNEIVSSTTTKMADWQVHLDGAWSIFHELVDDHEKIAAIDAQLDVTAAEVLQERVDGLITYVSDIDVDANVTRLKEVIGKLAFDHGTLISNDMFADRLSNELAGLVMTAHPTFALSKGAWDQAKQRLEQKIDNGVEADALSPLSLLPEASPTLQDELAYANDAIRCVRQALREIWRVVIEVGSELYPDGWRMFTPKLVTIASWVGFDLDGRTDIGWSQSLHFRYITTLTGLRELETFWQNIIADAGDSSDGDLVAIQNALGALKETYGLGLDQLKIADANGQYGNFNRIAVDARPIKEEARRTISEGLDAIMNSQLSMDVLKKVAVFRSEWSTIGLGLSHIHFRLNAAQLHNAIRPLINLQDAPDRSASRRHYLDTVAGLLGSVEAETIHYGSLSEELTTARRVFMLAAQFRKHFDDNSALRMLVAESDTPFTLLVALYYAKLFGVDDYVEISPLFETAIGLQRGDRVIAELLDNPHFLAYVKKQGRFCVQLGFSDSGRYVGQVAASLAIERFKLRLVRLWKERGLESINLVFFDTHGESIGRGANPEGMRERFLYTHTPEVRKRLDAIDNVYKHEVSFQGGDGYMRFLHPNLAIATMTDLITARLASYSGESDALYSNADWSLDFFLTLTEAQEKLAVEDGYVRLIDSIGQAMLYATGSRATKRQSGGRSGSQLSHIGQIRAIPNNAVLQQVGYMANSVFGLGLAANRNPRRFREVIEASPRLKSLTKMTLGALAVSDLSILGAYLSCLSPSYLLDRCEIEAPSKKRSRMLRLAKSLEGVFDGNAMRAMHRSFRHDAFLLEDMLAVAGVKRKPVDPMITELHMTRMALIHFIHAKAMQVPQFSTRQDVSLDEFIDALLHLNVDEAIADLREIFPVSDVHDDNEDFGETASFSEANSGGYEKLHADIFDNIDHAFLLIRKISSILATKIGAVG